MRNIYLERYASQEVLISSDPPKDLKLIITIPCFNEPDLVSSLISLSKCKSIPKSEVIVLINEAENCSKTVSDQNEQSFEEAQKWVLSNKNGQIHFYIIYKKGLLKKHAGVGLARKLAMDEAVRRFEKNGNKEGVIVCFDADSACDENYLQSINEFFEANPKSPGSSIYYEHPLEGPLPSANYTAIKDYELFLRYYTNALRFAQFPHAYQTVGSSMAVKSWAYQKQGGMPKRKAGEDFHFINKIIPLGNFGEINNTRVIPSSRVSDRVPFGTGKAVNDWLKTERLLTYNPKTFEDLKDYFNQVDFQYKKGNNKLLMWLQDRPESIRTFLKQQNFEQNLERINRNSTSLSSFRKHFFLWFDAFQCMKFIHFSRDQFHSNVPISDASKWLLGCVNKAANEADNTRLLEIFRSLDRKGYFLGKNLGNL